MFLRIVFVLGLIWGSSAHAFLSGPKLDVLFVVDNSGSMEVHQKNLASSLGMINTILGKVDLNAAVITTSIYNPLFPTGFAAPVVTGQFVAPVRNSTNPDFVMNLGRDLLVGTNGDYLEQPFATLLQATTSGMLAGPNAGFIRGDADLMIVFLTDTEDQSGVLNFNMSRQLKALKGAQQIFILAGMPDRTNTSCEAEPVVPVKITDLVTEFNGQIFDICNPQSFTTNFSAAIVKTLEL